MAPIARLQRKDQFQMFNARTTKTVKVTDLLLLLYIFIIYYLLFIIIIIIIFPLRSSRCVFRDLNDFFVKCRNKSFCTRLCYKVFLVHFNVSLQTFLTIVQSGIFVQEDSQRDDKCSNTIVVKYDSFVWIIYISYVQLVNRINENIFFFIKLVDQSRTGGNVGTAITITQKSPFVVSTYQRTLEMHSNARSFLTELNSNVEEKSNSLAILILYSSGCQPVTRNVHISNHVNSQFYHLIV